MAAPAPRSKNPRPVRIAAARAGANGVDVHEPGLDPAMRWGSWGGVGFPQQGIAAQGSASRMTFNQASPARSGFLRKTAHRQPGAW